MSIPVWPAELPRPMKSSYALVLGDNRRMRSSEEGSPRPRRGWSHAADQVSLTMICSRDQRARFERFRIEEVGSEAIPFIMPDAGTDGWELLTDDGSPLLTEAGVPILLAANWLCIFGTARPQFTPVGVEWQIAFQVVILP